MAQGAPAWPSRGGLAREASGGSKSLKGMARGLSPAYVMDRLPQTRRHLAFRNPVNRENERYAGLAN